MTKANSVRYHSEITIIRPNPFMNMVDSQYLEIATQLLTNGEPRETRNGIRHTQFGPEMKFNLALGFPLLTTKKMFLKGVIHELLWFLRGSTNVKELQDVGVHIWDANADESGELGPIYGKQWRDWDGTDQITQLVDGLCRRPFDTRHVLSAWNPPDIPHMQLPPCHMISMFDVDCAGRLSCKMFQRSADWFLGVPFNVASYALLTQMLARVCGYEVGNLFITFGNAHIYDNHRPQMLEQITRRSHPLPWIRIKHRNQAIDEFQYEDFELLDYKHEPAIKGEMSV
jgi:thymidylate synthase